MIELVDLASASPGPPLGIADFVTGVLDGPANILETGVRSFVDSIRAGIPVTSFLPVWLGVGSNGGDRN